MSLLAAVVLASGGPSPAFCADRPLTLEDVLDLTRIDRVALSPDGEWAAVVVQRAARPGEVYGRTFYDLDPSRGDLWLISRRSGERRNLTRGAQAAAGFWCPAWSPDGARLAMLSTRPEGNEPRGGDNVRLYVWDRAANSLRRASDAAMMTQTRTPLYRLDVRGPANGPNVAQRCHGYENAPFTWVDNRRILALMLPQGGISGLIDEYSRPLRHAGDTMRALRAGTEPTVTAVGSGAERISRDEPANSAIIRIVDMEMGNAETISTVPIYPFRGDLTVSVSPDRRRIAVLATLGAIPPASGQHIRFRDSQWFVEKRLGFVNLMPGASLRWAAMPVEARYPLELFSWSPDGRRVALRARADPNSTATPVFVASADDLAVTRIGSDVLSVGGADAGSEHSSEAALLWVDDRRLLGRASDAGASGGSTAGAGRADWWLMTPGAASVNVTASSLQPPAEFRRSDSDRLFALVGSRLMALNPEYGRLEPLSSASLPDNATIVWPRDAGRGTAEIVIALGQQNGTRRFQRVSLGGSDGTRGTFTLPQGAELLDIDLTRGTAVWREATQRGLYLREARLADDRPRDLLALNAHLAAVDWGRNILIDYLGPDGRPLQAAAILPPGYTRGRRYPTILWVYGGYQVRDLEGYFLDRHMGGFYNLYLYAARGYVLLIPSMPLRRDRPRNDSLPDLAGGAMPAADRLVEMGIADPTRLGVMGQSFGGFSVYALVTQTNRFRAAVAMAGITNLASFYTQFDPTARGRPGIEHEKSDNFSIAEVGQWRLGVPPWEDPALYRRNSPIAFVDRVETPLLLIHGEYDIRGPMSDAESFFYSLYRQGKTARLLRYWGENHGLSQSPANVRNVFEETVSWFDRYLRAEPGHRRSLAPDLPSPAP